TVVSGNTQKDEMPKHKCTRNAVYCLRFTCGHAYIGETGKCVKTRWSEHISSPTGHVLAHRSSCSGTVNLSSSSVFFDKIPSTHFRKLVEAFTILQGHIQGNISSTSL